jgi:WD40 repeat protein
MSVHPDEQRVAVAGLEGVQVWTTQPAPALDLFERAGRSRKQGFEVPVNGPDGRYVAHIDSADTPHLYGLTPNADDKTLTGHGGDVQDVAFGTDGQKVATGEEDGTLRLWDTETGEERFRLPHSQQIIDVSFAGQGDRVVVLLDSTGLVRKETPRTVVIWDTETQRRLAVVDSVNGGIAPRPISVTPDRSHVLIVRDPHLSASERRGRPKSDSVRVEVWNTETGEREHVFGREKKIENLLRKNTYSSEGSISPDGTYALVNRDSSVAALNLKSGEVRERIYGETATRIAFGSKEKRAALQIGGTPGDPGLRVPIVTLQGAEQLTIRLQEGRRIGKGLRFGPKNRRLAMIVEPSGSNQSHPSVWHVPPGRATPVDTTFLPTHSGTVASPIQFSPDGSYLLTVGEEEVRLFGGERRKPDTYLKEVMDLQHPNPINWVEFTPGGRHVITHTEPGTVRAWPVFDTPQALIDTARARITRPLTDAQREEFNLIQ